MRDRTWALFAAAVMVALLALFGWSYEIGGWPVVAQNAGILAVSTVVSRIATGAIQRRRP